MDKREFAGGDDDDKTEERWLIYTKARMNIPYPE